MSPGPIPPAGTLAFESASVGMLVVHAVLGFTSVGASTHHAVYSVLIARGQKRFAQLRRFSLIAPAAVITQVLLGMALYPTYRVRVRAADFDLHAPVLTQLFDLKEHLAALSVPLLLGAVLLGRTLTQDPPPPPATPKVLATLSVTAAAFIWTTALIGSYITARHPVGMP
ncbi:MAG: hypothetical protein JST92_18775 [Deltaproteobacteria bacterium]|nr:hypothetical protein [Deltaproteobacteria bacterium]